MFKGFVQEARFTVDGGSIKGMGFASMPEV
jgi:hypothetical protein